MKRAFQISLIAFLFSVVFLRFGNCQSSASATDPTVNGPMAVSSAIYNFGDTAMLPGFPGPLEFQGSVHYPTNLSGAAHPLIVFLHGAHAVCTGSKGFIWPCSSKKRIIPSFKGYDYLAQNLASFGYIVVSISANGITAVNAVLPELGALARAQLIQEHLDFWNTLNTKGGAPFGTLFVGKVDMTKIGTVGHSVGGEGVIRHFIYNQSLGSPYTIKAVFAIAPTDYNHNVINRVPFGVMLPYCDADVITLEGIHYYDDSRYNVPGDPAAKHAVLVMGANHNFFNTIWTPSTLPAGASDDWNVQSDSVCGTSMPGNSRLTPIKQQRVALAYVAAFVRAYVGGETQFMPLLTGAVPAPRRASPANIHVSYHAPDDPAHRLDLDRFLTPESLTADALGGTVDQTGLTPYSLCGAMGETTPCLAGEPAGRQPHTDSLVGTGQLSQLMTGWAAPNSTATYDIPAGQGDTSAYQALQFRVAVNFADPRNTPGVPQDFSVVLTDGTGTTASVQVSKVAPGALFFPPGSIPGQSPVPRNILNMVRIPLSAFSNSGIMLNDIRQIQFKFDRTSSGGLLITDVAFTSPPTN